MAITGVCICGSCGKSVDKTTKTTFGYYVNCICCEGGTHKVTVYSCEDCEPAPPKKITPTVEMEPWVHYIKNKE
jgi:hypothetical protein